MTDEELIEQLQEGNTQALDEIYRRYSRRLFVFIRQSIQSESPEDIVHDVFMRLIKKSQRFNPKKASFRTWIFTVARNRCIDLLRRQRKVKFQSMETSIETDRGEDNLRLKDVLSVDNPHSSGSSSRAMVIQAVNDCLGELQNRNEKQALVLYYCSGKVYREIGEIFGKSISMIKKHIASAQEKIRRCLEEKGIEQI